ncbi:IS1 family transposase [Paenibacillus thalictri]|uniref:IS1 family transposase n=1 Tax=Paenibacillus thalictri TaxID=2527873 RepID=A0A4Q9DPG1_9BACL|nr:IS1 family transposase [Paenibacillus thalictri]TBL76118.1 IS1 family transposase [Paenibacillus thalictri]
MNESSTLDTLMKMLMKSTGDRKKHIINEFEQKFQLHLTQIRDRKNPSHIICPGCQQHGHVILYGYANRGKTRHRFHCKKCERHFNDHTDTIFHNKKLRNHLYPFLEMMLNGISIRKTATDLGISPTTAHTWRHAILRYIEKNKETFIEILSNEEIIESSTSEFKPSRKGLPRHLDIPSNTQVLQFQCNRQKQFYLTYLSEGAIKPKNQLIKGKMSVELAGTPINTLQTSSADRLLHHSRHVTELNQQFADAYQRMRGVAQPYLLKYALWYCLCAKLSGLNPKERLHSLLLLCL